jgi:hypothetical protein
MILVMCLIKKKKKKKDKVNVGSIQIESYTYNIQITKQIFLEIQKKNIQIRTWCKCTFFSQHTVSDWF